MAGYFEAGELGHVEKLAFFVESERDLTVADGDGMTLLHHAAKNGHLDACRWAARERSAAGADARAARAAHGSPWRRRRWAA